VFKSTPGPQSSHRAARRNDASPHPPAPFTQFTAGRIFDFDWSADGKQLLLARDDTSSDVVLISNFR
jgi:hypothetical protein